MEIRQEEYDRLKNIEVVMKSISESRPSSVITGDMHYEGVIIAAENCLKPELYAGHTEEEWQRVIEGKFDVRNPDIGGKWQPLDNLDFLESFSVDNIEIRRELGHRQPCFGVKPNIHNNARVVFIYDNNIYTLNEAYTQGDDWSDVIEFIQLTTGTTNET